MPTPCPTPAHLQAILDGRLNEAEQSGLARHLDDCPHCQELIQELAADNRIQTAAWAAGRGQPALETALKRVMAALKDDTGPSEGQAEPTDEPPALDFLSPADKPGQLGRLGPYEVTEVIGRGGMGVVLKALDPSLNRYVAIKVIAPQLATSAAARKRFAREAKAAAAVSHEHIVAIHAVDQVNGLPYLVMEYVPGISLQERLDRDGPLELKEILRLGVQMAAGLAAAHAQGLVHRDIKPANILLENCIERVKITDFGLARMVDDASLTQSGVLPGTPQYMAPEQARGEAQDHRVDLFSLGSVLYTLCTGHPPFRANTTMAVLRRVSDEAPRPVRHINPEIPEWLAAIIARLHAKEPADRFPSAAEVAELLGQHLAHLQQPLRVPLPQPMPSLAPERRFAGRRWAVAAAVVLCLLGGLAVSEATGGTDLTGFVATVLRIRTPDGVLKVEIQDPQVNVSVDEDGQEITITGAGVHEIKLRPGKHRWQATRDGVPIQDDVVTISRGGKEVVRVGLEAGGQAPAAGGTLLPDRLRRLATSQQAPGAGPAATPQLLGQPDRPLAGAAGQQALGAGPAPAPPLLGQQGALMLDGKALLGQAASEPRSVLSVNGKDPRAEVTISRDGKQVTVLKGGSTAYAVPLSPGQYRWQATRDGRVVREGAVNVPRGGEAVVWVGREDSSPKAPPATSGSQEALPQLLGQRSVLSRGPADVRAYTLEHPAAVWCLAFAPDGRTLATGSQDQVIRLWQVGPCKDRLPQMSSEVARLPRDVAFFIRSQILSSTGGVLSVAFSPDGKRLAGGGLDHKIHLWQPETGRVFAEMNGHQGAVACVRFAPDGRGLASGGGEGTILLWDAATGRQVRRLQGHKALVSSVAFSPDAKLLASGSYDGTVRLWNVPATHFFAPTLPSGLPWDDKGHPWEVAADGTAIISPRQEGKVFAVAFAPDGKHLASAGEDKTVHLWDVRTGKEVRRLQGPGDWVTAVAFSPDGKRFAAGSKDSTVHVWDVTTGREVLQLRVQGPVTALAFSPDGRLLAAASQANEVGLWFLPASPVPRQQAKAPPQPSAIEVTVQQVNGKSVIRVNGKVTDLAELPALLTRLAAAKPEVLILDAAPNIEWTTVVAIEDAAQQAGIPRVYFGKPSPRAGSSGRLKGF